MSLLGAVAEKLCWWWCCGWVGLCVCWYHCYWFLRHLFGLGTGVVDKPKLVRPYLKTKKGEKQTW